VGEDPAQEILQEEQSRILTILRAKDVKCLLCAPTVGLSEPEIRHLAEHNSLTSWDIYNYVKNRGPNRRV
jgi:hypothetical protein